MVIAVVIDLGCGVLRQQPRLFSHTTEENRNVEYFRRANTSTVRRVSKINYDIAFYGMSVCCQNVNDGF